MSIRGNKNIIANIYRKQAYDIDFILKDKSLLDYENVFSPNEYEKIIK